MIQPEPHSQLENYLAGYESDNGAGSGSPYNEAGKLEIRVMFTDL